MKKLSKAEREAAEAAVEVTRRAIRRLDILEWVIYAFAGALALAGGAGVAWMIVQVNDWDFRLTWIVTSMLLFVIPGGIVLMNARRQERDAAQRRKAREEADG